MVGFFYCHVNFPGCKGGEWMFGWKMVEVEGRWIELMISLGYGNPQILPHVEGLKVDAYPISSMGLIYLPTWMVDFYGKWIGEYTIHGFYGHAMRFFFRNLRVDWIGLAGRIMKCMPPPNKCRPATRLACRHRYHYECLMTWCAHARRANVILCPVCRQHHPLRESWDSKKHPVLPVSRGMGWFGGVGRRLLYIRLLPEVERTR